MLFQPSLWPSRSPTDWKGVCRRVRRVLPASSAKVMVTMFSMPALALFLPDEGEDEALRRDHLAEHAVMPQLAPVSGEVRRCRQAPPGRASISMCVAG